MKHQNCTIIRTKIIQHRFINMDTLQSVAPPREEIVDEPCNTPLFGDDDKARGICKGCHDGWEVPGNKFASYDEFERAIQ